MSGTGDRTHRNHFFSRGRSKLGTAEEGTNLDDLEAGTREFMINDMPDIPEASGQSSGKWGETEKEVESGGKRASTVDTGIGSGRVDPRTGIVSPQAVASDSALERGELPMVVPRHAATEKVARF